MSGREVMPRQYIHYHGQEVGFGEVLWNPTTEQACAWCHVNSNFRANHSGWDVALANRAVQVGGSNLVRVPTNYALAPCRRTGPSVGRPAPAPAHPGSTRPGAAQVPGAVRAPPARDGDAGARWSAICPTGRTPRSHRARVPARRTPGRSHLGRRVVVRALGEQFQERVRFPMISNAALVLANSRSAFSARARSRSFSFSASLLRVLGPEG